MREYLFRAKRKSNGKWVEGYFFKQFNTMTGTDDCYIRIGDTDYLVFPETVGQYTGLTDKNGWKIFEGDIVKFVDTLDEINAPEIGVVVYEQSECCFEVQRKVKNPENVNIPTSISVTYLFSDNEMCLYEVIGNIHDNPELLEDVGSCE